MARERINQRLIAKRLRLSPATVSKSFRNHRDIKPETRAKVLACAQQLGYDIDTIPYGPSQVRLPDTRFIGAIVYHKEGPEVSDVPGQSYVVGLSEAASRRNISMIIHRFTGESEKILDPAHQPPAMRQNSLEGLVLIHHESPEVVTRLAERIACVTLTYYIPGASCDHIDSNHLRGMTQLIERLFKLGHRKIGFLGHPSRSSNSLTRFGAFSQAMARLSLPVHPGSLANVFDDSTRDFDEQADFAIRKMQQGITAWVCASDSVGYNLCKRLQDRGIRVPHDVSITGYDVEEPPFGLPFLTSVQVPFVAMGDFALERLLQRIENPWVPFTQTLFDCKIVDGETTGPAPLARK